MARPAIHAVVVGGSITGLMAAIVLRHNGNRVTVLERTKYESFKGQGAGLGIRQIVADFVEQYKPKDTNFKILTSIPTAIVIGNDGSRAADLTYETPTLATSWDALVTALQECLGTDSPCHYGATLTGITELGDGKLRVEYSQDSEQAKAIESVDLVIGADGSRSTVRRLMLGEELSRPYAGYVMYRGTIPRSEVSPELAAMHSSIVIYPGENHSAISYAIPSRDGGEPNIMYGVYYHHDDAEFADLMTDSGGHRHPLTLPPGKMRADMVAQWKDIARRKLAPQLCELVVKSRFPSVQAMADTMTPANVFLGGRVLLVGEAVATLRPHIFAGTIQSTFHAQHLRPLLRGEITAAQWGRDTLTYSDAIFRTSSNVGGLLLNGGAMPPKDQCMSWFVMMSAMLRDLRRIQLGKGEGEVKSQEEEDVMKQQLWNGICLQAY